MNYKMTKSSFFFAFVSLAVRVRAAEPVVEKVAEPLKMRKDTNQLHMTLDKIVDDKGADVVTTDDKLSKEPSNGEHPVITAAAEISERGEVENADAAPVSLVGSQQRNVYNGGCDTASDAEMRYEGVYFTPSADEHQVTRHSNPPSGNDNTAIHARQAYRGCQTETKNGLTCAKWTHSGNLPSGGAVHGPIKTLAADPQNPFGVGDHNFCRAASEVLANDSNTRASDGAMLNNSIHANWGKRCSSSPDVVCKSSASQSLQGIWCYTTNANERWAECDPLDTPVYYHYPTPISTTTTTTTTTYLGQFSGVIGM